MAMEMANDMCRFSFEHIVLAEHIMYVRLRFSQQLEWQLELKDSQ